MFLDTGNHHAISYATEPSEPLDSKEIASLQFYASFNRWMTRQWKRHLSLAESVVLDFVFDRTVGWGKEWEAISIRHAMDGYAHDQPHCASTGTGLSTQAVVNALRSLCDKGTLRREEGSGRCATRFAINFHWTPASSITTFKTAMLRLPKNHDAAQQGKARSALPSRVMRSTALIDKRENKEEGEEKLSTRAADSALVPATSRFLSIVEDVRAEGAERAARAKASTRFSAPSLLSIYHNEWSIAFSGTTPTAWKKYEEHALVKWGAQYQTASSRPFAELFAWCVARWRTIMALDFKTFKNTPAFPAVGFMVKFSSRFEDAYLRKHELDTRSAMTERDAIKAAAMDKGLSPEAAERQADEKLGIVEQKRALTRERQRLLAQQQQAGPRVIVIREKVANDCKPTKPQLSDLLAESNDEFPPYEQ